MSPSLPGIYVAIVSKTPKIVKTKRVDATTAFSKDVICAGSAYSQPSHVVRLSQPNTPHGLRYPISDLRYPPDEAAREGLNFYETHWAVVCPELVDRPASVRRLASALP
jgi:hypothetical protein